MKGVIKKYNKNQRLKIVIIFFVLLALAWYVFDAKNNKETETVVEVIEVDNFSKELVLFDDALKQVWVSLASDNLVGAKSRIGEAERRWIIIADNFTASQPDEYAKTKDWASLITDVSDRLKKSTELIGENNLSEARREIAVVINALDEMKKENGRVSFDGQLLSFYEIIEKVSAAPSKEAAVVYLPELKIAYTFLKGENFTSDSAIIITKMESEIGIMDKSFYGPDFQKAQTDLRQDFFELFLK